MPDVTVHVAGPSKKRLCNSPRAGLIARSSKKIVSCSKIDTWFQQNIPLFPAALCWLQLSAVPVPAPRRAGSSKRRRAVAALEQPVPAKKLPDCSKGRMPVPAFGHRGCSSRSSRFQHPMPPHGSTTSSTLQHRLSPYAALARAGCSSRTSWFQHLATGPSAARLLLVHCPPHAAPP